MMKLRFFFCILWRTLSAMGHGSGVCMHRWELKSDDRDSGQAVLCTIGITLDGSN